MDEVGKTGLLAPLYFEHKEYSLYSLHPTINYRKDLQRAVTLSSLTQHTHVSTKGVT